MGGENLAQYIAYFPDGSVSLHTFKAGRHGIILASSDIFQSLKRLLDIAVVPVFLDLGSPLLLSLLHFGLDSQQPHYFGIGGDDFVYPYHGASSPINFFLIPVGGVLNFPLLISLLYGSYGTAQAINFGDILPGFLFQAVG